MNWISNFEKQSKKISILFSFFLVLNSHIMLSPEEDRHQNFGRESTKLVQNAINLKKRISRAIELLSRKKMKDMVDFLNKIKLKVRES